MTIDKIIKQIAKQHHTTPEHVRREIEVAMKQAKRSRDPAVQARWNAIPHKREEVTLEEFINYIASIAKFIS